MGHEQKREMRGEGGRKREDVWMAGSWPVGCDYVIRCPKKGGKRSGERQKKLRGRKSTQTGKKGR